MQNFLQKTCVYQKKVLTLQPNLAVTIMDIRKILQYKTLFDVIARQVTDDDGNAVEVWYARDLQQRLGYARWENFVIAIGRAMEACKTLGINIDDHFRGVTKTIELPKGAKREVLDFMLTRYACYMIESQGQDN